MEIPTGPRWEHLHKRIFGLRAEEGEGRPRKVWKGFFIILFNDVPYNGLE